MFASITVVGAALFLDAGVRGRLVLLVAITLVLNALVTTVSRSGFLALVVAGFLFNLSVPPVYKRPVRVLSVLALVLFVLLTNPLYWGRMDTIKYAGQEVEGVDTAHSRVVVARAQWEMFKKHPFGCGHRCTAALSPKYLDDRYLTGPPENRARSSHNVLLTLLVEQGVPGVIFYLFFIGWYIRSSILLMRRLRSSEGLASVVFPATVAVLGAGLVADLFVDLLKFEMRFWFAAMMLLLVSFTANSSPAGQRHESDKKP
jgi:O-antigen ligase